MKRRDLGLLRKMISLALLPEEKISETFHDLRQKYEDSENERFFLYFEREWMLKVKYRNKFKI